MKSLDKFIEVYAKIILEANDNNLKMDSMNNSLKINKDSFKNFIGRKFISAYCKVNRKKSLIENEFIIIRGSIEDIEIKHMYNSWEVKPIFNKEAQRYGQFDTSYIKNKRLSDCTPEKFEEMLKKNFSGEAHYSKSFQDPYASSVRFPEEVTYNAPDDGQSDEEIKQMMIDVVPKSEFYKKYKVL
jgi:hypothetical protein